MLKIIREYDKKALASECKSHPNPGEYLSIVEDAYIIEIEPFYEDNDTCFVIVYRLVDLKTLEVFHFSETYSLYNRNPRSEYFFEYLQKNLPQHELEEELIGMREQLKISWEILGGYAYPIVVDRTFLNAPEEYKQRYLDSMEVEEV